MPIKKITCIVTYGNQSFEDWALDEGLFFKPLAYLNQVFEYGLDNGRISEQQFKSAIDFLNNSTGWREERGLLTKPR